MTATMTAPTDEPITDVDQLETDALQEQLARQVNQYFTCFDIRFSWQRVAGQRQIKDAKVVLRGVELESDKASKPTFRLMPDTWREKFQEIETDKSRLIRAHTLPGMAGGTACVRSTKSLEFLRKLMKLRETLHELRGQFIAAWDEEVVRWNEQRWREHWNKTVADQPVEHRTEAAWQEYWGRIRKHLPAKDQIENIIDLTWSQFSVMPSEPQFQLHGSADSAAIDELLATTREMTNSRVEGFVEAMFAAPRERLVKAVQKVQESLRAGRKITDATFNEMRNAVQFLREMTDLPGLSDANLLERVAQAEEIVRNTPRKRGAKNQLLEGFEITPESAVSSGLVNALDEVIDRADNATVVADQLARFGRMGRGLDLDDE